MKLGEKFKNNMNAHISVDTSVKVRIEFLESLFIFREKCLYQFKKQKLQD